MKIRRSFALSMTLSTVLATFAPTASAAPIDTTADAVVGQADFAGKLANRGGAAASNVTLNEPRGVAIDPVTGRLFVADALNNRVLSWQTPESFTNGKNADLVIGQVNFVLNLCNRSANVLDPPARNTLCEPRSVAVDSAGRLYVADFGNHRVLRFDPPIVSKMDADQVFGQAGSFVTKNQGIVPTADNLGNAEGVAVDGEDNLFITDLFNSRVLGFNQPALPTEDTTADAVFGQANFTSGMANRGGNPGEKTLQRPETSCFDAEGNMYVADNQNNRVLLYLAPLATDMSATRVYGQPNFSTNGANQGGLTATSMSGPVGVAIDPITGNLFVADAGNSRILEFADPKNDSTADRVFGQGGDFTTGTANKGAPAGQASADTLNDVGGVAFDAAGRLYAGDRLNHRILRYDAPPPAEPPPPPPPPPPAADACGACGQLGPGMAAMMPMTLVGLAAWRRVRRKRSGAD
ncbi:MAG TPA: NHL repeat-containing protein [Phycisphaerae bacterium]|nr:NHL repeat-containing protein [Phycisphaerae bacterium]